ncbi:hypothetical protein BsWGS_26503 [Bradybaena similaris]
MSLEESKGGLGLRLADSCHRQPQPKNAASINWCLPRIRRLKWYQNITGEEFKNRTNEEFKERTNKEFMEKTNEEFLEGTNEEFMEGTNEKFMERTNEEFIEGRVHGELNKLH